MHSILRGIKAFFGLAHIVIRFPHSQINTFLILLIGQLGNIPIRFSRFDLRAGHAAVKDIPIQPQGCRRTMTVLAAGIKTLTFAKPHGQIERGQITCLCRLNRLFLLRKFVLVHLQILAVGIGIV